MVALLEPIEQASQAIQAFPLAFLRLLDRLIVLPGLPDLPNSLALPIQEAHAAGYSPSLAWRDARKREQAARCIHSAHSLALLETDYPYPPYLPVILVPFLLMSR